MSFTHFFLNWSKSLDYNRPPLLLLLILSGEFSIYYEYYFLDKQQPGKKKINNFKTLLLFYSFYLENLVTQGDPELKLITILLSIHLPFSPTRIFWDCSNNRLVILSKFSSSGRTKSSAERSVVEIFCFIYIEFRKFSYSSRISEIFHNILVLPKPFLKDLI